MKKPNPLQAIADASGGRTLRTIEGYRSRGMPTASVKAALKWIEKNIRQQIGQPTIGERTAGKDRRRLTIDELEVEELRAKIRKLDAEAEAKEMNNARVRGELYDAAEVERNIAELTGLVRVRLESIPDELQTEWPTELRALVTQRMTDKIRLILTEMSQFKLTCDDAETGERELQAATTDEVNSLELPEHSDA